VKVTPWLPLLRRLTSETSTWAVWKSAASAFAGDGDVDAMAVESEWPVIAREFRNWARDLGADPVIRCTHFPGLLILVACWGHAPTRLLQLDVYSRHLFRGVEVATPQELLPFTETEESGYRRLRPGAEGLLLLLRGMRRGGRAVAPGARERIRALLQRDPAGAARLALLLGFPMSALADFESGGWDRRSCLEFELRVVSMLVRRPADLLACLALDYRRFRGCALVELLERTRRVETDRSEWLPAIEKTHLVEETSPLTA
jgi:hypothetical protein